LDKLLTAYQFIEDLFRKHILTLTATRFTVLESHMDNRHIHVSKSGAQEHVPYRKYLLQGLSPFSPTFNTDTTRDFRLPPRSSWEMRSSVLLRNK